MRLWVLLAIVLGIGCSDTMRSPQQTLIGAQGPAGTDGTDGQDGTDGEDGADGQDGTSSIIDVYDPCGDYPGYPDEVLLIMDTGQILRASKRHGLRVLSAGNYKTRDKQHCHFTISLSGEISD